MRCLKDSQEPATAKPVGNLGSGNQWNDREQRLLVTIASSFLVDFILLSVMNRLHPPMPALLAMTLSL